LGAEPLPQVDGAAAGTEGGTAAEHGLSDGQLDALIGVVAQIKGCPTYSLNYGRNKPYEESCVDLLVGSATKLFAAFLPGHRSLTRDAAKITGCPVYSVNYGRGKPYEENCVDRIVEIVVADLKDLKAGGPRSR
jgi:hypothetical protein